MNGIITDGNSGTLAKRFGNVAVKGIAMVLLTLAQAASAASATGGTVTNTADGYRIHVFTNNGTLSVTDDGYAEVLVVAGGGGGGIDGGGGGGGGLVYSPTNFSLVAGDYTVIVGGGGAPSGNGTNSVFSNSVSSAIIATGGGHGGDLDIAGGPGGSGGGGGGSQGSGHSGGAASPPGQGNAGGSGGIVGNWGGSGGGGGANASGSPASGSDGAPGGNGLQFPLFAGLVPNSPDGYFAGGGGGGEVWGGSTPSGGAGGGGKGGLNVMGTSGKATTGGGGGGGAYNGNSYSGGSGGSGVVIVRYYVTYSTKPAIANEGVSNVTTTAATLIGKVTSTGSAPVTAVSVYWGPSNGGTDATLWANTNAFAGGPWNLDDVLTTDIASLAQDSDYYFTYSDANSGGSAVASPSQYLITGALNVYAVDPLFGSNSLDTATFTVTRPSTCTVGDLPFNCTFSGTATNGVDYTIGWSGGSPTIPAGQTNATLTVTPILNANNFQTTRSLVVTLNPGAYVLGTASNANGTFQSFPMNYTWNNAHNGATTSFLDPANWTPANQFLNIFGEICDINANGVAGYPWSGGTAPTFAAQLNVNSNAVLSSGDGDSFTFANLHLRGGTLSIPAGNNYAGHIFADNNSLLAINDNGGYSVVNADFSGAGNLCVSNNTTQPPDSGYAAFSPFMANNTNYSGVWSFYSTWGGGEIVFAGDVGTGGLNFGPISSNISINVNTACPWTLDLRGGKVFSGYQGWSSDRGTANPVHTGTFTLLSDSIISANGNGNGVLLTINGRITGIGRLRTWALSAQNPGAGNAIKLGGASDYTGGTVVMTNILEAATAGSLGAGNVEVQPGAKLKVDVSATMNPQAKLYLDGNGVMDLGAGSVTTTVSRAFVGGTGGWQAPSGYTQLASGTYTQASPGLAAYLVNNGVLKVLSPTGLTVFIQ